MNVLLTSFQSYRIVHWYWNTSTRTSSLRLRRVIFPIHHHHLLMAGNARWFRRRSHLNMQPLVDKMKFKLPLWPLSQSNIQSCNSMSCERLLLFPCSTWTILATPSIICMFFENCIPQHLHGSTWHSHHSNRNIVHVLQKASFSATGLDRV